MLVTEPIVPLNFHGDKEYFIVVVVVVLIVVIVVIDAVVDDVVVCSLEKEIN